MTRTDTDLRDLLAARGAVVPDAMNDSGAQRVTAVNRRVRAIRRRRTTSAALGVVVLLLVVTSLSGLFRGGHEQVAPVPAYQQKVAGGVLPRYLGGGAVTAYTSFDTNKKREATFTFTPTSWTFLVTTTCDKEMPETQLVSVSINGHPMSSGSCSPGFNTAGPSWGEDQARAQDVGIHLGVSATVHVQVVHLAKGSSAKPEDLPVYHGAMDGYQVAVGLYTPVPVDEYPFPPRPHKLESLDDENNGEGQVLGAVDSRAIGANGHASVVTTLTAKGVHTELYTVAPGSITVTIDGHVVDVSSSWTWTQQGFGGLPLTPSALRHLGIDVKTGDHITVSFAGSRFAVPGWRAQVREGSR